MTTQKKLKMSVVKAIVQHPKGLKHPADKRNPQQQRTMIFYGKRQ
jgi:hypothetical protein